MYRHKTIISQVCPSLCRKGDSLHRRRKLFVRPESRRARPMAHLYTSAFAAFSISAATSLACEMYTAWLPGSSIVSDLALLVMKRSRSGLIIRSCLATTAKLDLFDQAAA